MLMRRFDVIDENVKDIRGDLFGIGKKVDVHAVSIKNLELQMSLMSPIVNTCKPDTLPRNTI